MLSVQTAKDSGFANVIMVCIGVKNATGARSLKITHLTQTKTPHPCIGRCSTSLGDYICKGCHRTAQEVIGWNGYTREQKIVIIERLDSAKRKARISELANKFIRNRSDEEIARRFKKCRNKWVWDIVDIENAKRTASEYDKFFAKNNEVNDESV